MTTNAATTKPKPIVVDPVTSGAQFERIDQGVDYSQTKDYVAVAAGTVYDVCHGCFVGGSDTAVYIKLNQPVTINGHTYQDVYYAETTPLVKQGQTVTAGEAIAAGGAAELGFASGDSPAAPLVGGLGAGTQPTQAGRDFYALIGGSSTTPSSSSTAPSSTPAASSSSGGGLFGGLESWLTGTAFLALAYMLLIGVAGALLLTGAKGLGVKTPRLPRVVPV